MNIFDVSLIHSGKQKFSSYIHFIKAEDTLIS